MSNKNGQKSSLVSPSTPNSTKKNLSSEEINLSEPDVMCNAPDAINKSIIPTQHDNTRVLPFYVQDIKNFSAFKNTLISG